METNCMDN